REFPVLTARLFLPRHASRRKGGDCRREAFEPRDEPRVIASPGSFETEIEISERAGGGDLAEGRRAVEPRRLGFERGKRPRHLAGLVLDPLRHVMLGRPPAAFINPQDPRIEQAVAQRLLAKCREALGRRGWNGAAAAGAVIEIFEDYAGIVERGPVLEDQH